MGSPPSMERYSALAKTAALDPPCRRGCSPWRRAGSASCWRARPHSGCAARRTLPVAFDRQILPLGRAHRLLLAEFHAPVELAPEDGVPVRMTSCCEKRRRGERGREPLSPQPVIVPV